jgi:hypothetical protein
MRRVIKRKARLDKQEDMCSPKQAGYTAPRPWPETRLIFTPETLLERQAFADAVLQAMGRIRG